MGYALKAYQPSERFPSIVPKAWHDSNLAAPHKVGQKCAADIVRAALNSKYEGCYLRAVLDQVVGVRAQAQCVMFAGHSPSVKMRLEKLEILIIGDKPWYTPRIEELSIDHTAAPVTTASQVLDFIEKSQVLPKGWTVASPLTCVDPYYSNVRKPTPPEEPMPEAKEERSIRWLGEVPEHSGQGQVTAEDHVRASPEAAAAGDIDLEAVTSSRTTLQLLGDIVQHDCTKSSMLHVNLRWAVDKSQQSKSSSSPRTGQWVPRSALWEPL